MSDIEELLDKYLTTHKHTEREIGEAEKKEDTRIRRKYIP